MDVLRVCRRVVPAVAALGAAVLLAAPSLIARDQDTKTFYLTVLDSNGQPVTDLRPDEVAVGEMSKGGQPERRELVSFKKAESPASIVLLADTSKATGGAAIGQRGQISGSGLIRDVRDGFSAFIKAMAAASPDSEMELVEFGQAAVPVTRMTTNLIDLEKGINRLFPKEGQSAVLLEAITDAAKTLQKAKHSRRAIVAMNVLPTDERSAMQPTQMLEQVQKANASFWIVSYNSGTVTADPRGVLTNALANNTGGKGETIAAESALVQYMTNIANALANQYEVQYKRPAGATPERVVMGVGRQGLTLHHSIYPPK